MTQPTPDVTLSYCTVTQASVIDVISDSSSSTGNAPVESFVLGTVTFTPSVGVINSESPSETVYIDPIVGRFTSDGNGLETFDGTAGVELVDNVGLGLDAGTLTYRVDYHLNGEPAPSFMIVAPGDGTGIDLNNVANRHSLPSTD